MSFEDVYLNYTKGFEAGYVNNPYDSGGETFRGISRKSHPDWEGWAMVDTAKAKIGKKAALIDNYFENNQHMTDLVTNLYKKVYWDPLKGTPELPELVKQKVFDTAVNMGTKPAAIILQKALNRAAAIEVKDISLSVDGIIGTYTRLAAQSLNVNTVLAQYSIYQKARYDEIIKNNPKNERFKKGWYKRAEWLPKKAN
jgi:lysozyme family protein